MDVKLILGISKAKRYTGRHNNWVTAITYVAFFLLFIDMLA